MLMLLTHVQMQLQKLENSKKNAFMICLCHSHMFRCSYKNQKTPKKCIHDICLCYPCMFRCCTKGRGSAPLCDFQRTSTNQCSLQLASCRGHHPHMCKNILPTIESKKCKNQPASILDGPASKNRLWHRFPSALAASASCGTSFGLLWQPQNGG